MIYNPHNYFVIRTSERTPLPSLSWNQTFNMYIYMLLLCFLSQIHPHTAVKHTSSVPRTETEALDQQAQRYDTTTEPAAWSCSHSPRVSVLPTRSLSSHTGWPLSLSMRHHPSSSHWETSTHTQRERGGGEIQQLFALTADDCPWFWCFSEAENLAQRHAPFHIHTVSSSMGLNSGVNHGDHLSRGGETGWRQPH